MVENAGTAAKVLSLLGGKENLKVQEVVVEEAKQISPIANKVHAPLSKREVFIKKLTNYINKRNMQVTNDKSNFHTFFGWLADMSSTLKISAANKVIDAIKNPHKVIEFTHDELVALSNSRLGKKMNKFTTEHPKQYCQSVKEDSYNLSKRF